MNLSLRSPLSRRHFLRGSGALLTLPWLESMTPRFAAAAGQESPRRFVGMMTNMGILPEFFFPKAGGRDYEATPYLQILAAHRAQMTVFSGVALPGVDGGHASEQCFLTGAPGASRGSFKNSISLDQVMAETVGENTRFPSLTLMVGAESMSISYTRSGSMIPPEKSPLKLYQKLFIEDTAEGRSAAHKRIQEDRSLLDGMRTQFQQLQKTVTAADRDRLEQFATAIRDLERRLTAAEGWIDRPKPKVAMILPKEIEDRDDLAKNSRVMFDLAKLALETDSTRVLTLSFNTGSVTPKKIPGVKTMCHGLTHHGQRPETVAELRAIEETQFHALNDFCTGLSSVKEGEHNLLERTSCLYGTNMGSANAHSTDNLPALLIGGGFQHGQHLAFDRKNNYALTNLHLSLLHRMGVEAAKFSSSTGTMRGLELA
jgi:hypothetical protein